MKLDSDSRTLELSLRLAALTLITLATLATAACSKPAETKVRQKIPLTHLATVLAETAPMATEVTFDGVVEATHQATVAAQTSGRVVALKYDVGDYVQQGAIIAELTSVEQGALLSAAESELTSAKARFQEAEQKFSRGQQLFKKDLMAKADFDQVSAALTAAKAQFEAAQARVVSAKQGLQYTTIQAPYAGIVVARLVQVGESVSPGTPLISGISLDTLRVAVDVPQQHIAPLRQFQQARIGLADGSTITPTQLRIPPKADDNSHAFHVLAELPTPASPLFPGTLVKVSFVTGTTEQLLIPAEALVQRGEVTGAYVVTAEGIMHLRYIQAGAITTDQRIPVFSGLQAGERIALDPVAAAQAYKFQNAALEPAQ